MWWEGQLLSWWRSRWNAFILVPVVTLSHTLREWPAGNISAASRVFQHGHTRSRKVAVTTETPSGMFSISQMDDILLILIDVSFFSVWSWSPQPTSQSLSSRLFSIYLLFSEAQGIFQGFVCVCEPAVVSLFVRFGFFLPLLRKLLHVLNIDKLSTHKTLVSNPRGAHVVPTTLRALVFLLLFLPPTTTPQTSPAVNTFYFFLEIRKRRAREDLLT